MQLPFIASTGVMILVLLGEIVLLHVLFVWLPWLRLSEEGWTKARYATLTLAVLGVLGAVSNVRRVVANNLYDFTEPHLQSSFQYVRDEVVSYSSSGIVCRKFVRSSFSPPAEEFNRIQLEFDRACAWFKELTILIPEKIPDDNAELTLPAEPVGITSADVLGTIRIFRNSVAGYNQLALQRRELRRAAKSSGLDDFLLCLLPLSLSFVLALEFTRVTGELKIKKEKAGR